MAAKHEAENPETIDLDDDEEDKPVKAAAAKAPKGPKVKVPNFDRFRMLLGLGGLALVALIVFLILALTVLPKATITVHTTSEPVAANFNLTASDKSPLDPAAGTIPAKLESMDQTGAQQHIGTFEQCHLNTLLHCGQGSGTACPAAADHNHLVLHGFISWK